jgi:putative ABC transport system permease protein
MLTHYLLTLYRSLSRHRLYAAINVLGLAVGIAVFLVLFLDVRFETSFNAWIPDARQIYAVETSNPQELHGRPPANSTMGGLLTELRGEYPDLVGTRMIYQTGVIHQGDKLTSVTVDSVDSSFFKVFDLPLLEGDRTTALKAPDDVVLTRGMARKFFVGSDPLGRSLSIDINSMPHVFRVVGVIQTPPPNSSDGFDFLIPLNEPSPAAAPLWWRWDFRMLETYLRLKTPAEARALDSEFDAITDRHANPEITKPAHTSIRLRTRPLIQLHLSDPKDAAIVAALGVVGLLTLLLAAVNYVNLATARAGLRAREVAVRKVMGATVPALIGQFMAEALATAALGAILGLALCELTLPMIDAAGGLHLKLDYLGDSSLLLVVLLIVVGVGLGAGAYPALVLSRFQPAAVLASAKTPGGGRVGGRVREGLVVVQFAVAIAFMICTAVVVNQMTYLRRADIGFQRNGLIVVNSYDDATSEAQKVALLTAWRSLAGVSKVTAADIAPGDENNTRSNNTKRPGMAGEGPDIHYVRATIDFFQTYRARLLAGRLPDPAHGGDLNPSNPSTLSLSAPAAPTAAHVVINRSALETLGFRRPQNAVGQTILEGLDSGGFTPVQVIGVIDDIRFRSPRDPVPPTIYVSFDGAVDNSTATIRYAGDPHSVMAAMGAQWRRIVPNVPFSARTIDDNLARYYRPDDQHGRLFIIGALLAVGIGCVGLYGLASFNTARRVKEIGIRKTLGASTSDILKLLVGQFLRPVVIANLFAWPLAWWAMSGYLSGFDQRIALSPVYFLAATALTLLIAVATVAGQAYAVARAEPARALRRD